MSALRVLIADDEEMARRRLRRLLAELPDVAIVAECASGDAALSLLESIDVDVAVLDVQMPGLSGLDLSQSAAELGVEVILATAHREHALTAYERGVIDYVLKPVEPDRLAVAIERARARIAPPRPTVVTPTTGTIDRLAVTVNGDVRLFDPARVVFAMLVDALVRLRIDDDLVWTEASLQTLEARLTPYGLLRVHRRALLNLAFVDRLRPLSTGGYVALTRHGDEVPVSRQEARRLRQRLGL